MVVRDQCGYGGGVGRVKGEGGQVPGARSGALRLEGGAFSRVGVEGWCLEREARRRRRER